jgi:gluconokinase
MGVAGAGKTTIASQLALELGWEFLDADSFHSPANVAKMRAGIPLDDVDRAPWLQSLRDEIERATAENRNLALACSALKRTYRDQLCTGLNVTIVYLKGTFEVLRSRLALRKGHFMTEQLLASQLESLEEPSGAVSVNIDRPVQEIVAEIRAQLGLG